MAAVAPVNLVVLTRIYHRRFYLLGRSPFSFYLCLQFPVQSIIQSLQNFHISAFQFIVVRTGYKGVGHDWTAPFKAELRCSRRPKMQLNGTVSLACSDAKIFQMLWVGRYSAIVSDSLRDRSSDGLYIAPSPDDWMYAIGIYMRTTRASYPWALGPIPAICESCPPPRCNSFLITNS